MIAYRVIALLILAITGVMPSPCGQGQGQATGAPSIAAAAAAQATSTTSTGSGSGAGAAASGGGTCPPITTDDSKGPQNVGVAGKQFVTGQCVDDANCASGCCVLQAGGAVCRNRPALNPGQDCGFSCSPAS